MSKTASKAPAKDVKELTKKFILTGEDITVIGEDAELLVGGKNYNTAIISQVPGIRAPQFRAVSSVVFHKLLDETKVNAALIRACVDHEYGRVDWTDEEVTGDPEYMKKLVRILSREVRQQDSAKAALIKLRTFINNVVEGFATSPEGIDQLRKRSVLVQVAILSVDMPLEAAQAVRLAYQDICKEAGQEDVPIAVRSSAAGEDSRKKAFAGLQDTYLNVVGEDAVEEAYQWDCASAYNLRSMTYRREAILDAVKEAERTGDDSIAEKAKKEWAIEHTSLSVCLMRMINPAISGTAFSAETSTGCRGGQGQDLVSIDASYGLGEAVVGGMVTPDKLYVFGRDDGHEVVIRFLGYKGKKIVYDERGGTKVVKVEDLEAYSWAISMAQAEEVARGVRSISKSYGGIIMDTEFCIDHSERLWFVQARPETRWNEEFEQHPRHPVHAPHGGGRVRPGSGHPAPGGQRGLARRGPGPGQVPALGPGAQQDRQGRHPGRRAHRPGHGAGHARGLGHPGRRGRRHLACGHHLPGAGHPGGHRHPARRAAALPGRPGSHRGRLLGPGLPGPSAPGGRGRGDGPLQAARDQDQGGAHPGRRGPGHVPLPAAQRA